MDFTKFVWMLDSAALFFCRADLLGDPFEGSVGHANLARRREFSERLVTEGVEEKFAADLPQFQAESTEWARRLLFVNCWHLNRHESAAMWRLYAQTKEAIAIQSTVGQLRAVLDRKCFLGQVTYVDYGSADIPEAGIMSPLIHKRLSFEHERELRAITLHDSRPDPFKPPTLTGLIKVVDLSSLISAIHTAPLAPPWFRPLVERVATTYGVRAPVRQSGLDDDPIF